MLMTVLKYVISHCHKMFSKQECITVGYVPTAAVAATRCQYMGGVPTPAWEQTPPPGGTWIVPDRKSPPPNRMTNASGNYYIPLRSVIRETHIATESLGVDGFVSDDGCSRDVGSQHISFP